MSSYHRHSHRFIAGPAKGLQRRNMAGLIMAALGSTSTSAWALPAAPAMSVAAVEASGAVANPDYLEFSSAFTGSAQGVDVSRFEKGNYASPGTYRVDIYVNDGHIARDDIVLRAVEGSDRAVPCFTYTHLQQMGVDAGKLDPSVVHAGNSCMAISDVSLDASATMDVGDMRLDVSIPQAALKNAARGYVSPELWDQGETAFLLGYTFNAYSSQQNYHGAASRYGTAMGTDGVYVPVQNGTYYALTPSGSYVPSANGNFALSPNGSYVPVRNGTYVPPNAAAYRSNNINAFLGLNLGFNVAGWRVRSQETAMWDQRAGRSIWHNIGTTATHDVTAWKAQLTMGDGYTQGILFDTTPYRGISLYSDDRMLPDSQLGYAPVVRGMANTQARVEVRQSGNLLYETTVAPGPFVISDLYATGYGGDLTVIVFEADGSTRTFAVPYAAVPMLLRPGISRWAVTDGQVRDTWLSGDRPYFVEGTYQRGINNWLTAYAGVQSTYRALYKAYLGGVAVNTPMGAMSLDVTRSHTNLRGANSLAGYSARLTYSKSIPSTDTTFALASYRYSNGNFMALSDAVSTQDWMTSSGTTNPTVANLLRSRQRLQVTLNQNFAPKYGSLYFTGSFNSYWNATANATTYQLGYNNSYRRVSFGITASRTYSSSPIFAARRFDNQFGLNVSIPLGGATAHTPTLTASAIHDDVTGNNDRLGINGSFGSTSQYNYGATASYADTGDSSITVAGNIGWQAAYANLNAGYSYASHYQQASMGASGGLVVHHGGITLSPSLDLVSPIGIVEAPDATGARVASSGQTKVDSRGYAVATGLIPYRMNDVTLDPVGTSTDIELKTTRVQTAPRAGAVVPLTFSTSSGRAALIRSAQPNGEPLPFGAQVLDEQGQDVGSVAQGGQLLVRGAETGGLLTVRWGDAANQRCRVQYSLPARAKGEKSTTAMSATEAVCR